MQFELVSCKTYSTLKKSYTQGQEYSVDDSERGKILGVTLEDGTPVFREIVVKGVETKAEDKTAVPKAPVKKVITLGGKKPGVEKKVSATPDISTGDLNQSEPDALV